MITKTTALLVAGALTLASLSGCGILLRPLPAETPVGTTVEIQVDSNDTSGSIETIRNGLVIATDTIDGGGSFTNNLLVKPGVTLKVVVHVLAGNKPVNACKILQYLPSTAPDDPDGPDLDDYPETEDFPVLASKKLKGAGDLVCEWTAPGTYTPRPAPTPAIGQGPVEVMLTASAGPDHIATYTVYDGNLGQTPGPESSVEAEGASGQTAVVPVGGTVVIVVTGIGSSCQITRYDAQAEEDGEPSQVLVQGTIAKTANDSPTCTWRNQ